MGEAVEAGQLWVLRFDTNLKPRAGTTFNNLSTHDPPAQVGLSVDSDLWRSERDAGAGQMATRTLCAGASGYAAGIPRPAGLPSTDPLWQLAVVVG